MAHARPRRYRPSDRRACLAVFESNVPDYFVPEERPEFEAFLDALPGTYLVLDGPGDGVGACGGWAFDPDTERADLCWGMVRRDLHGRGFGRLLTEARLEAIRRDRRAGVVALATSQLTTGFYERLGFRVVRVVEDGFAPGLDRCEMRLELPSAAERLMP